MLEKLEAKPEEELTDREKKRMKTLEQQKKMYCDQEKQMAEAGCRVTANRTSAVARLAEAQTGAETAFPAADLLLTHPDATMPDEADALAEAFADNRQSDLRAGRTLVGPHRVDLCATYREKGVAAAQCSTGEQKALLISLVLTNARALAEDAGAPPLILLDEVAAHLDADRRAALYDEICALDAQAWMTGTEPELFEELAGRAQFIEVTEDAGASHARQVENL
jgi:DNA replication and repair protein RecF